jgi:hypothetical protein
LSTIGLLAACRPQARQEPGLQALADDFRAANQAANYQPMLRLYYTEGCDERSVRRLKLALEYELGLPIKRIDFESLAGAPEETIDFIHAGIHYGPSLKPRYRMRVVYSVEDHFTSLFTIGKSTSGDWHIICAKPEPEPAD